MREARFAPHGKFAKLGFAHGSLASRVCAQSPNQWPFRVQSTSDMDVKLRFSKWKQTFFSRPWGGLLSPEIPHSLKPSRGISGAGSVEFEKASREFRLNMDSSQT